jgi:type IV pilus assembly protein PilX
MMSINKLRTFNRLPRKQEGAALVVSLIILLVMTLIGVSSMSTSLLQEKMASNAQSSNITFQAAESAVGMLVRDIVEAGDQSDLNEAMGAANGIGSLNVVDLEDPRVSTSYQVTYLGVVTLSSGGSLDADESSTTLQAQRFDVASTASIDATGAQTVIKQGIEYR